VSVISLRPQICGKSKAAAWEIALDKPSPAQVRRVLSTAHPPNPGSLTKLGASHRQNSLTEHPGSVRRSGCLPDHLRSGQSLPMDEGDDPGCADLSFSGRDEAPS